MRNWLRRQVWVWALSSCLPLLAQEFRAGITGIVKDAQGAVVPGVPIEAQNLATNDIGRTTTNETGYYASGIDPSLPDPTDQRYFNTCLLQTNGTRFGCASATEPVAFIQQQNLSLFKAVALPPAPL